jgi:hypothetical protein
MGGAVAIRAKGNQASPLREPVYVSDVKLQMFLDQIDEPDRRSIAAELKVDVKLVSLTLTSPAVDRSLRQRSRMAKLAVVEVHIKRHHHVGDLTSKRGYFAADTEMGWKPLDDNETVLFCGYAQKLLVVLGGSVSHLTGLPSSEKQIGSHPYAIRAALQGGGEASPGDLGRDLEAAAHAICGPPESAVLQPVRFLARVIARGPLGSGLAHTGYLMATPLYVEHIDTDIL